MTGTNLYRRIPLWTLAGLMVAFCIFAIVYQHHETTRAQQTLNRHARIIADNIWNFNVSGVTEYLKLAATADNYAYCKVTNSNGDPFYVQEGSVSRLELLALKLKLVKEVNLASDITFNNHNIGRIEVVWIPHTPANQIVVFVICMLLQLIITLYCRILSTKAELEKNVIERTLELTEANEYLIHEIQERTRTEKERAKLQRRLEQSKKMETVGVLAGGVAHDLNNVLSGIVSYPDLMLRELPADSPLRRPIELIKNSGLRAAEIVQDLLTLARRSVVTKAPLSLNRLIDEYLNSPEHEKLLDFHPNLTVSTALDEEEGVIMGSAVALKKVLMNLITNGAEAMDKGGKITVTTKRIKLSFPLEGFQNIDPGEWMILSICDEGEGISGEDMARIFEPFYTKKVMGRSGSGLGLTVVWGTIEDHGGAIDIHKRAPKGTTIEVFLPIVDPTAAIPDIDEQADDSHTGNGETIMVIDDVDHQREIASAILTRLGYKAVAVGSGEEAVAWLQQNRADLLILDMIMEGGMDGLATYEKILELHPYQRAIIASGYSETARARRAQSLGAGQYLKKPYQYSQIAEAVWKELRRKK